MLKKIRMYLRGIWVDIKHFSIKKLLTKIYYRIFHGIKFGEDGSMLPDLGKVKMGYTIKTKGAYTDIIIKDGTTYRIIPSLSALGFYLEVLDEDGNIKARTGVPYKILQTLIDKNQEAS